MAKNKLTDAFCKTAKDGTHSDGDGLVLRVGNAGARKSWGLRIMVNYKAHLFGLGGYPAISLAEARRLAKEKRNSFKDNVSPEPVVEPEAKAEPERKPPSWIKDLVTVKVEPEATGPTFKEVAQQVIDLHEPTWTSLTQADRWVTSLQKHAYPTIGDKPIATITSADVLGVLLPIWNRWPEQATRVKQRLNAIMEYAIVSGLRLDNPTVGVGRVMPRVRQVNHQRAVPFAEVSGAIETIRASTSYPATRLALEFIILTASRGNEVRGMTWQEIDGDTWNVPASRMKMRQAHRVPLSGRCLEILAEAGQLSDCQPESPVFPGNSGQPLTRAAFTMAMQKLEIDGTTHGFRSSFKDWSIEYEYDWALAETQLAHRLGNALQSAYARTDLLDRRRPMMQNWADYVTEVEPTC